MGNTLIPISKTATLLGMTFDQRASFKAHRLIIAKRVHQRIGLLIKLRGTSWGASKETLLRVYKSFIRPVIEYGSVVLADCSQFEINKFQILQNRALRVITQRTRMTRIEDLHQMCSIETIKERFDYLKEATLRRFGNSELMQDLEKELIHL